MIIAGLPDSARLMFGWVKRVFGGGILQPTLTHHSAAHPTIAVAAYGTPKPASVESIGNLEPEGDTVLCCNQRLCLLCLRLITYTHRPVWGRTFAKLGVIVRFCAGEVILVLPVYRTFE